MILNFVYTKKFLKDVIAGFTGGSDIMGKIKQSSQAHCVMEDVATLKMFNGNFFKVIDLCKSQEIGVGPSEE